MSEFTILLTGLGLGTAVGLVFAAVGHVMIRNEMRRKIDVAVAEVKADMYRAAAQPRTHDDRGRVLPQGGSGSAPPRNMWSGK